MTTQYATASYQEIIDLHTESDKVSVVGIHTPNSDTPYHMLKGFWNQFRKFKYNGCSMSLVPAAQLPPDPLNVSYEAGEPTIDPRDMLNPILFHGCHGDDMGAILNTLYSEDLGSVTGAMIDVLKSDSIELNNLKGASGNIPVTDMFESLYYRALTDKTWLKAHPQKGFRKSGLHPMIYSLASTVQYANRPIEEGGRVPYATIHDDSDGSRDEGFHGTIGAGGSVSMYDSQGYGRPVLENEGGSGFRYNLPATPVVGGLLTPRLQRLGWMDTRLVKSVNATLNGETSASAPPSEENLAQLFINAQKHTAPVLCPKIYMGMIMLPPAYKCEQYFRLVLNHSFSFAKFRGASMQYDNVGMVKKAYSVFNFNDVEASKKKQDEESEKHDDGSTDTEE